MTSGSHMCKTFQKLRVLTSHLYSLAWIDIPISHGMEAQELQPAVHLLVWEH
jgi:hypothetical protein